MVGQSRSDGGGVDQVSVEHWYVAQLRPNQLARATSNLERQNYATFMPKRPEAKRHGRRCVQVLSPLFPGYIFVQIAPDQSWREIASTYGVLRLVMRSAHEPQPVPQDLMEALFVQTDPEGVFVSKEALNIGDRVRITMGPVADVVAEVVQLGNCARVGVLLELMGRAVRAELPQSHVVRLAG